jgi:hypothetical protein
MSVQSDSNDTEYVMLGAQIHELKANRKAYLELRESRAYKNALLAAEKEFTEMMAMPDWRGTGHPDHDDPSGRRAYLEPVLSEKYGVDFHEIKDKRVLNELKMLRKKANEVRKAGEEARQAAANPQVQVATSSMLAQMPEIPDDQALIEGFEHYSECVVSDVFDVERLWLSGGVHAASSEEVLESILAAQESLKEEYKRLCEVQPAVVTELARVFNTVSASLRCVRTRVDDRAAQERAITLESWEELVDDERNFPEVSRDKSVTELLLGKTILAFPDFHESMTGESAYQVEQQHPQLNASRIVTSTMMYVSAAKNAMAAYRAAGGVGKPVVFDIGAGSFGAERLQFLKQGRGGKYDDLCLHASIPDADSEDHNRLERFRRSPRFMTYNYVPQTRRVFANRFNYCHHKASECDCLKYYTENMRYVVAVHSAYYFEQSDYEKILSYVPFFEAAVHLPQVGQTTPLDVPEYVWEDTEKVGASGGAPTFLERLSWGTRRLLRGIGSVRMRPVKLGGTTYVHEDIHRYVAAGGFHCYKANLITEPLTRGDGSTLKAGLMLFGASAALSMITCPFASMFARSAVGVFNGLQAVALAALTAGFNNRRKMWTQPLPDCSKTVHIIVKSAYGKKDSEPLVTVLKVAGRKPSRLVPNTTDSEQIDKEQVKRATASLALAGDQPKSRLQVAARLCRDGLPIKRVKDTVQHAARCVRFLGWGTDPPPAPTLPRILAAAASLPFASAASQRARSTLLAACPTTSARFAARALFLGSILTYADIMQLFLLFLPMWLVTTCVVTALWAHVASA